MLFLDECVPIEVGDRLTPLLQGRPERPVVRHLVREFEPGTADRVWLQVVKANRWLLLTADRGKSNRGEKLPRVCRELGVIHVVLSATLHSRTPSSEKALAVADCWSDIVEVWTNRIGCGHSLRRRDRGPGYRLVDLQTGKARRRTLPDPGASESG